MADNEQIQGYRGEPWKRVGRVLYDRDGNPFGEVYKGAEEFAETIVRCVNLLTNVPIRATDGPLTNNQQLAILVLQDEARKEVVEHDSSTV